MPVLWFHTSTCFWFWSKIFTKHCSNNSLLSFFTKTISSLLDLTGLVLLISECFGKTLTAFDFDEKLTKRVGQAELFNITWQKTFFPFTLQLVRCFQFQGMIWKRDMLVQILILILFHFCLICWLKKHLFWILSVVAASCFNYIGPCTWF